MYEMAMMSELPPGLFRSPGEMMALRRQAEGAHERAKMRSLLRDLSRAVSPIQALDALWPEGLPPVKPQGSCSDVRSRDEFWIDPALGDPAYLDDRVYRGL
jgi:hypothetical protein